jgi:hypothetical protein
MFWMKYNQNAAPGLVKILNEGSLIATTDRYFWNIHRYACVCMCTCARIYIYVLMYIRIERRHVLMY